MTGDEPLLKCFRSVSYQSPNQARGRSAYGWRCWSKPRRHQEARRLDRIIYHSDGAGSVDAVGPGSTQLGWVSAYGSTS